MKKIYTFLLFLFFHSYFCQAQPPDGNDDNRVEVVKMAYMTQELNLSPQEAQNFWPVYNNYTKEIKQARVQYATDEVAYEKKVVEIKERYQGNFKRVLGGNDQRINKVYTSERKFKDLLRTEQKTRQENHPEKQFQQPQERSYNPNKNNGNKNNNKGGVKKQHPPR